jgi:hypothetical protein
MLGIEDKLVALLYILCIASALLCIIYGAVNWNRGESKTKAKDIHWAEKEKEVEKEL